VDEHNSSFLTFVCGFSWHTRSQYLSAHSLHIHICAQVHIHTGPHAQTLRCNKIVSIPVFQAFANRPPLLQLFQQAGCPDQTHKAGSGAE